MDEGDDRSEKKIVAKPEFPKGQLNRSTGSAGLWNQLRTLSPSRLYCIYVAPTSEAVVGEVGAAVAIRSRRKHGAIDLDGYNNQGCSFEL